MRQLAFDVFAGADKVLCVVVMLFDTRSYGKHIRIENNIVRVKTYFINQKTISTLANFYLRAAVSACPFSSKAITTAAAPYCLMVRACSRNLSSPPSRRWS